MQQFFLNFLSYQEQRGPKTAKAHGTRCDGWLHGSLQGLAHLGKHDHSDACIWRWSRHAKQTAHEGQAGWGRRGKARCARGLHPYFHLYRKNSSLSLPAFVSRLFPTEQPSTGAGRWRQLGHDSATQNACGRKQVRHRCVFWERQTDKLPLRIQCPSHPNLLITASVS